MQAGRVEQRGWHCSVVVPAPSDRPSAGLGDGGGSQVDGQKYRELIERSKYR